MALSKEYHYFVKKELNLIMRRTGAIMFGDFTLKSGQRSTYYLDVRKLLLDPQGLMLTSEACASIFNTFEEADVVAGVELGAVPLSSAILLTFAQKNVQPPVRGAVIRKKVKDHGTAKRVEGYIKPNDIVVIVEDVVTTGSSTVEAIKAAWDEGLKVCGVIAVIDREQGGKKAIEDMGVEYYPLMKVADLNLTDNKEA